jgi:hypothetical protein
MVTPAGGAHGDASPAHARRGTMKLGELQMRAEHSVSRLVLLALAATLSGPALATSVAPNSTIINNFTPICLATDGSCAQDYLTTNASNITESVTVPPTQSFTIADTFNQSGGVSTVSNFGPAATGSGTPWNFQDSFLFTTNGATVQANAISFTSSVSDLQIRIIELPTLFGNVSAELSYLQNTANAATLLGGNSPGNTTVEYGWSNFVFNGQDFTATTPAILAPGDYVVQVRGEASGGSSYSGNVQLTPVPLPASAWLLLSGMAGLAFMVRGRRHAAIRLA